jgi:hypothetical protein
MSALVTNPVALFVDTNGDPLQGGSIYVGLPNTDPTKNPIDIFQDAAQSIPFPQPINTTNGVPTLQGSPRQIFLGADATTYSIAVFDSAGNMVESMPSVQPAASVVAAGNMNLDIFEAGTDFVAGTTTSLTLSGNPGSANNVFLTFDPVLQFPPDDYGVSGQTLTFTSPIPEGTTKVRARYGTTLAVGAPGTGTVTDASVAANAAINSSKISYTAPGVQAVARTVQSKLAEWIDVMDYGATGTGTSDDTAFIQAAIDENKGGTILFPANYTFLCAGVTLNGAAYNGTTLIFEGWMLLKPDGGAANFGGAWVGLLLQQCDGVTVYGKFNGNRANMTAREQIFCLGLAGATNVRLPRTEVKEIRGDGIYIGQSNWQASSTTTTGVICGQIIGSNSADDGRNIISIISASNVDIEYVYSQGIGGVIDGVTEPGGIDIEPDNGYETCNNIRIGYADIITAGSSGLSVSGKSVSGDDANRDWNCFGIKIDNCNILLTGTSGASIEGLAFTRVADLKVKGSISYNTVTGVGPTHDYCQRVELDWTVANVTVGVWLGPNDFVEDFSLNLKASGFSIAALRTTGIARGRMFGRAGSSTGAGAYAVQCHNNGRSITQVDASYSIDAPYDGAMARSFRNEVGNQVTYGAGCVLQNCDATGYALACDAMIAMSNVLGLTSQSSIPTSGSWSEGQFVTNSQPVQSAGRYILGWSRLNSGSNNVLNNDWSQAFVAYV